VIMR